MKLIKSDNLPGYDNVHNGALYYRQTDSGFLQIEGPDRFDFLQRQTTNDINLLTAERTISTLLVSPTARILDVFNIFIEKERLGVITLPGYAAKTTRFLQSRIFFMDKVAVIDSSDKISQIVLGGLDAENLLTSKGIDPVPELSQVVFGTIANIPVKVMGEKILHSAGYRLLFPLESRETLVSSLLGDGTVPLPSESYQVLRVEAGIPAAGAELVDDYTSLEAGLETAIYVLENMRDDRNIPIMQTAAKILIHPSQKWLTQVILGSAQVVTDGTTTSQQNNINPMFTQGLTTIESPYFTDEDAWFVLASEHDLNWHTRIAPENWSDVNYVNSSVEIGARFRSAVSADDARGVVGSAGA